MVVRGSQMLFSGLVGSDGLRSLRILFLALRFVAGYPKLTVRAQITRSVLRRVQGVHM